MNREFVVEVQDLSQLQKVLKGVARVKRALSIERWESFEEANLRV